MVIEVSDSTLTDDKKVNSQIYAQAGIPTYWIVDIEQSGIFIHSNVKAHSYSNLIELGAVDKVEMLGVEIDIVSLLIS